MLRTGPFCQHCTPSHWHMLVPCSMAAAHEPGLSPNPANTARRIARSAGTSGPAGGGLGGRGGGRGGRGLYSTSFGISPRYSVDELVGWPATNAVDEMSRTRTSARCSIAANVALLVIAFITNQILGDRARQRPPAEEEQQIRRRKKSSTATRTTGCSPVDFLSIRVE